MANGVIIPKFDNTWTKLTGVNVSQTTVASASRVEAFKRNGVVVVDLYNLTFNNSGDNQAIITGLPKAVCQSNGMFSGQTASLTHTIDGDCCWISQNSTYISAHIGSGHQGYSHWATITYPTNE